MEERRPRGWQRRACGGRVPVGVALAGVLLAAEPGLAADWTGATSADWFTAGNWNPAAVPGAATAANINSGATPNAPTVGAAGAVASTVSLGTNVGQSGQLSVTGAGTLTAGGTFAVGDNGTGTLTVSGGGKLTTNLYTSVGNWGTATGTATVTGTGSQWTVGFPYFVVGDSGAGTLHVEDGGHVVSAFTLILGNDSGATGHVTVSGDGAQLSVGGTTIGSAAGSSGDLSVSGSGATWSGGLVTVGSAGEGSLLVEDGAAGSASQVTVGSSHAGSATVAGAGTSLAVTNGLTVGNAAGGTLSVEDGAGVTSSFGRIGVSTGATGAATVTGTDSSWTMTGALTIGQAAGSGSGSLDVLAGGAVGAFSFTGHNSAQVTIDGTGSEGTFLGNALTVTSFTLGGTGADNTLDVTGGGVLATKGADFRTVAGSGVAATVSGTGSAFTATRIDVGGAGSSILAVADGGHVEVTAGSSPSIVVDGADASLTISSGGSVTQGDFIANTGSFTVGESGGGSLLIESGGQLTSRFTVVGSLAGADASATVTGTGSTWTNRGVQVAFGGTGSLAVTGGGRIASTGSSTIAFLAGSVGSVTVSGAGSEWAVAEPPPLAGIGNITVGLGGTGSMRVEDGGVVSAQGIGVGAAHWNILGDGNLHPGNGSLVVTGAGSRLDLDVADFQTFDAGGDGGTGTIDVLDGAVVTVVGQGHFGASAVYLGADPEQLLGHGTLTIDGTGSRVTYSQTLDIGEQATGVLAVRNGGFLSNSDGYLGSFTNSVGSAGDGTATVTGAGSTWQNSGFLRVGDFGTGALNVLDGGLVTNTDATVANGSGSTGTVLVSGTGSRWESSGALTVGGDGAASLTIAAGGVVTSAGTVAINALSRLDIGSGGAAGVLDAPSILNDGTVRFDHTGTVTFAPPIAGSGGLVKDGAGTTILDTVNTYSGTTVVNGGTLVVNGSIANSAVTIGADGTLGGAGTVGSATVLGTAAPGNSIGTLNVAGDIRFGAASRFRVEIDDAARSDAVVSGGIARIDGGTVSVLAAPGLYDAGTTYTILTAYGGRVGRFSRVVDDLAFLDATLAYDPTHAYLTLVRNASHFLDVAKTPNQIATAGALEALGPGDPLFDAVLPLDAAAARNAFDLASGEIHASLGSALIEESRYVREAILDRMRRSSAVPGAAVAALGYAPAPELSGVVPAPVASRAGAVLTPWGQTFGAWGEIAGDGNAAEAGSSVGGFVAGLDATLDGTWRLGLAAGYSDTTLTVSERTSTAWADGYHLAAYAAGERDGFAIRVGGALAWYDIATRRDVAFGGLDQTVKADYAARTAQAFAEVAKAMPVGPLVLEPFAGLAYVRRDTDGYDERGGAAALSAAGTGADVGLTSLGVRVAMPTPLAAGRLDVDASVAWQHAFGDLAALTRPAFDGGSPFSIAGVPVAEDTLRIDAGIALALGARTSLGVAYHGQFGADISDQGVKATFTRRL